MYTLFIDTHSNTIRIILYKEKEIALKKEVETVQNHSNTIMPILLSVLNDEGIDVHAIHEIIVVNGPGSFTGVRLGVTIAKTLAFTLEIPIKVMSSLLIKAVSFSHEEVSIIEREKNGVFLGKFDKDNNLVEDYFYLSNKDYEKRDTKEELENIELNYEKIYSYAQTLESINPHAVVPLYVKLIEVQK